MSASLNPYIASFDEGLDVEKSTQYRLTIQLALGGLSFALFDTTDHRLVGMEFYQSELLADSNDLFHTLEKALDAKGLNGRAFQSVTCLINDRTNVLVPKDLYTPEDNEKWLSFGFNLLNGTAYGNDRLEKHKAINVFAYPSALQAKIKAKWPEADIHHSSSVFLENLPANDNPTVWINVRNRDFDMAIMKDKLLFFNNFKFNTKDDFAYFMFFAMEQNGLSGQDTVVNFSGLILPSSEIINLCGRYIRDIHFVEKPEKLKTSQALSEVPYQYYHLLYQSIR